MDKKIIEKLTQDEHYYGDYGKQFLSNSDISILLKNPRLLREDKPKTSAMVIGGYFHTAILEPDKLEQFRIIKSTTRNTKVYKEMSGGELCLLQHEVDAIEKLSDTMLDNKVCKSMIRVGNVEYETPGIKEIEGEMWKGKADIINHDEKLVIDLKTTADITKFKWSASKYNYDSQAYIYSELFGYEMIFIVIDKNTHQLGVFDCSPEFYAKGQDKVQRAVESYRLFYKNKDFDPKQYFINKTL